MRRKKNAFYKSKSQLHYGYDALTAEITKAFNEVLGIAPDRIYIKYEDNTD